MPVKKKTQGHDVICLCVVVRLTKRKQTYGET